jgi:hypothetical protein
MSTKTELREFKILLINSNIEINKSRFEEFKLTQEYKDLIKYHPNDIITGSWSLYLYGLCDRKPGDFDIIVSDKPGGLKKHSEGGYIIIHGLNSLGWKILNKTKFDFFLDDNSTHIEYGGIKICDPIYTIDAKLKIVFDPRVDRYEINKHRKDLNFIKELLEKEVKHV